MSKHARIVVSLAAVVVALLALLSSLAPARALTGQESASMTPQAGTIEVGLQPVSPTLAAGQTVDVQVVITNVTDMSSFNITLSVDPALVTVTKWLPTPSLLWCSTATGSGVTYPASDRAFFGADNCGFTQPNITAGPGTGVVLGTLTVQALDTGAISLHMLARPWSDFYDGAGDAFLDPVNFTDAAVTAYRNVYTWTGSSGVAWNTAVNWSGSLVPTKYDDAVIPGSTVTNWPSASGAARVHNLTIQAGAHLTLTTPITVVGVVANNGRLYQTQGVHTVGVPVAFMTLPSEVGAPQYQGLIITPTADMGNVTVVLRGNQSCGVNGTLPQAVRRCYEITPDAPAAATVQFFYTAGEANSNLIPNAYHWNSVAGNWTALPSVRGGSGDALWVRADTNSYSPFTLKDDQPTAVTLLSIQTNSHGPTFPWAGLFLVVGGLGVLGLWRQRNS